MSHFFILFFAGEAMRESLRARAEEQKGSDSLQRESAQTPPVFYLEKFIFYKQMLEIFLIYDINKLPNLGWMSKMIMG